MEPRGIIRQAAYYDGANRIASSTRPDFQAVWQNPLPGDHYLVAVATDVRVRRLRPPKCGLLFCRQTMIFLPRQN
jgi:hypothetical protein